MTVSLYVGDEHLMDVSSVVTEASSDEQTKGDDEMETVALNGREYKQVKRQPTPGDYVTHPDYPEVKTVYLVERMPEGTDDGCLTIVDSKFPQLVGKQAYLNEGGLDEDFRVLHAAGDNAVDHPSHYTSGKFETIEIIEEITQHYDDAYVGYCVGNALKYLSRAPHKHEEPTEDLRKAAKYIEFSLNHIEEGE